MSPCLFYKSSSGSARVVAAPPGYSCTLWNPGLLRVRPKGLTLYPYVVWWLFHHLRVFANRGYAIVLIHHQGQLVHHSTITPGYFRFPFMAESDLQVGSTWTSPEYRGKGLGALGLRTALASVGRRVCWYLAEEDNLPSIRVAEKAGFVLAGAGVRTSRFGLSLLGSFVLQTSEASKSNTSEVRST